MIRLRATHSLNLSNCFKVSTRSSSSTPLPAVASTSKSYYVTTPIFYVNAAPHIGHLHSTLLADLYTRYHAHKYPLEPRPILCTGTDEHGLKIQRVAETMNISPKELCDDVSQRFRELAQSAGIDHSVFIRTTEERHKLAVEIIWKELDKRGFIYKSAYSGWYAVSDEAYYTEAQVVTTVDPATGVKSVNSIETGTKVEWMEEETYKFQLSAFKEPLIKWLSEEPNVLQPPSRTVSLLAALSAQESSDFVDLSISRPTSRLSWGIRVPGDDSQTIYVWIDALVNYLTASGYPWDGTNGVQLASQVWPPELMVIGKDIIRFHAIYLPAILIALDLPLPRTLLAHGHWTMNKFKMSKSRGNVADPFELMTKWGRDVIRCWLIRAGGNPGSDADYSPLSIATFYRKDLVGQLGNLLGRIATPKLLSKLSHPEQISVRPEIIEPEDQELFDALQELPERFHQHMIAYAPQKAVASVFHVLALTNAHFQVISPWLPDASPAAVHRALFYARESMRITGILLMSLMPEKSVLLLDQLGVDIRELGENLRVGEGGKGVVKKLGVNLFQTVMEDEPVVEGVPTVVAKRKKSTRGILGVK